MWKKPLDLLCPQLFLLLLVVLLQLAPHPVTCDPTAATNVDVDPTGHLKPWGAQGPVSKIDSVEGFPPPEDFLTNHVKQNRPLLFKGAARSHPGFAKWTDAYFHAKTPPRPAGDVHIEHVKKEDRSQNHSYVHFRDFLRDYNTSDFYMVSEVPEFLYEDLLLPYSLQCRWFVMGGLDLPMTWFSSGGTSSVIHYDTYENINCLLRGRKSLVMLNSSRYEEQVEKIIDNPDRGFSSADVDKIDVKSRPEFANLEFHSVDMEAGDCLYIPNVWLHQVRSFDSNLAVNLWWTAQSSYNFTGCSKQPNPYMRFNRVFFGNQVKTTFSDADSVRAILLFNAEMPATEEDLLTLLSNGDIAQVTAVWPKFPKDAMSLFKLLDVDKDGMLNKEELTSPLKYRVAKQVKDYIMKFNIHVFAMHQKAMAAEASADVVGKLPKLIPISGSDHSVYAPERTWQQPKQPAESETEEQETPEPGEDENEEDDKGHEARDESEAKKSKDEL